MTIGGRTLPSLDVIAEARAQEVLSTLPPLQKVVSIIDIETATKIRKLEKLQKDVVPLKKELDEASETIHLSKVDQEMTIAQFRALVHEREAKRQSLIQKLNKMSQDAQALDEQINKALFAGLPGLSEAVIDTVQSYFDQSLALDEAMRRIEEQVKFGDSEAALSVLRQFEQDEAKISEGVAVKFKAAIEKLKLSVEKGRKQRRKNAAELAS